jgi:hypothetical protein
MIEIKSVKADCRSCQCYLIGVGVVLTQTCTGKSRLSNRCTVVLYVDEMSSVKFTHEGVDHQISALWNVFLPLRDPTRSRNDMPPLDVWMVLHAYYLNPQSVQEFRI